MEVVAIEETRRFLLALSLVSSGRRVPVDKEKKKTECEEERWKVEMGKSQDEEDGVRFLSLRCLGGCGGGSPVRRSRKKKVMTDVCFHP